MNLSSGKMFAIAISLVLAVSMISATAVLAQGPPSNRENDEEVPGPGNGEENETNGEGMPEIGPPEDIENVGRGKGIGERVREIVGEKVEEIHEAIKGENVSGGEIAGIAQEIGVEVEDVVRVEVRNIKNETRNRIDQEEDQGERMRMQVQQARAGRYDYAYDRFATEAREKINELEQRGKETEELGEILNEISVAYMEAHRAEDPEERAQEMKEKAQQFRNKFEESAGDEAEEIRNKSRERAQEAEEHMEAVRKEAWGNARNAALNVFQNRIEAAENKIEAYQQAGFNTEEMESSLEDLRNMETELEQAYEGGDREELREVKESIREEWKSIMRAQPEERAQEYEETIEKLNRTLRDSEGIIEAAQERGIDVAEAVASQEGIENGIERAKEAMEEGNYEEAKQEIENLREDFKEYREKAAGIAQELRGEMQEGVPGG